MSTNDGKIGFRIGDDFVRPEPMLVERIGSFSTPPLSDSLNKFYTMNADIKPILDSIKIAGSALTVRLRPGDNLMLHKAIGEVKTGDVIVVDTGNCRTNCVMGELIAMAAFQAGAAGIVIDGGIRDILELRENKYPIFARYIIPSVGDKDGPGEINLTISCGGVVVNPGDIIVGDANGVVVVPVELAENVIVDAEKKIEYEQRRRNEIISGILVKADINETLKNKGVI